MRVFAANVPFFLPVCLISIVLAALFARRVGVALSSRTWVAFLLITSVGLIVGATLTPIQEALDGLITSSATCDMRRIGLAPFSLRTLREDSGLNILLFIPLGVALGLLPNTRWRTVLVIAAVASPVLIETTQLLLRPLGRACQSADVFDNLTGLLIGFLAGSLVAWMLWRAAR